MHANTFTAASFDRRSATLLSVHPLARGGAIGGDELLRRYEENGGLVTGDHLAGLLSDRVDQAISMVARWILAHRVVYLRSQGQLLLPWFQFDRQRLAPCPELTDVVGALWERCEDSEIAAWFVTRHAALEGQWPLHALRTDLPAVLHAARQS